ncbi:DNA translocase FtsK 4TM domain-containing protein [Orbus wheelerorum]|uniref:DNA translocase FtsK 4TM domain-containing protein n=1 Tax=Orbus wheelerorum TaxID=3074111 RepID=UPI00370D49AA
MKKSDKVLGEQPKIKFTNSQILCEVFLFLVLAGAIYFLFSLVSFDPADPGWSQTAWHEPIRNWGGIVGAYLSDIFLQFIGFVAYSLPILIIIFCVQGMLYFYHHTDKAVNYFSLSLRVIGFLAFIFSATGFFALNIQDVEQFQAGGILGNIVADEVLPFLNHIGASIILFAFCIACITLLTGLSWFFIAEMTGRLVFIIAGFVVNITRKIFTLLTKKSPKADLGQEPELDSKLDINTEDEKPAPIIDNVQLDNDTHLVAEDALVIGAVDDNQLEPYQTLNQPQIVRDDEQKVDYHEPSAITIDENNPPPKIAGDMEGELSHEFTINPDYYSPIALPKVDDEPIEQITPEDDVIKLVQLDENDSIAPVGSYTPLVEEPAQVMPVISIANEPTVNTAITKDNIHDSLIHPLLQKDTRPVKKPTTPLPSLDLLTAPPIKQVEVDHNALKATAELIEKSLSDFRVNARVVGYLPGPVITRFEIELAPGIKASRISTLDRDLARSLSMSSVRVVEVIPGKPYVGLELPNQHRQTVYFREVLDSPQFKDAQSPLTIVLGKDIAGQSVVADLAKMPHLLVAGTTGSGKSVGVNAMILSILYKSQPEDVRFIMIDPKMLELSVYEGIPHLLTDVVTDMKDAANALNWCVNEMEKRYRLMSSLGVRNIAGYNEKIKMAEDMGRPIPDPLWRPGDSMDIDMPMLEKLPYIVVMVDEFADLIMAVGKKVEELIARLAQKARAAGIHLVLATQRPSVDVITGLIKANIPTRIAFTVSSKIDSRTILDQMGAESLLGMGDMLYLAPNSSIPIRVHGAFVRDEEVHSVVQDWKARGIPTKYIENITTSSDDGDGDGFDNADEELDPLFDQVVAFVIDKRRASISSVQRQFRIGYNRAARIVEQMESQGIVSTPSHNGNREVLAPPSGHDFS